MNNNCNGNEKTYLLLTVLENFIHIKTICGACFIVRTSSHFTGQFASFTFINYTRVTLADCIWQVIKDLRKKLLNVSFKLQTTNQIEMQLSGRRSWWRWKKLSNKMIHFISSSTQPNWCSINISFPLFILGVKWQSLCLHLPWVPTRMMGISDALR